MDIPSDITAKQMYDELMALMKGKERCYVLLDEVQEVPGWEKRLIACWKAVMPISM